jgi:hypothetical protein
MGLGVALVLWSIYSTKIELKKHFFGFDFSLHLISLVCISNLFIWNICSAISWFVYLFYKTSYQIKSVSIYVFTVLYVYMGINVLLFKVIDFLDRIQYILILTSTPLFDVFYYPIYSPY